MQQRSRGCCSYEVCGCEGVLEFNIFIETVSLVGINSNYNCSQCRMVAGVSETDAFKTCKIKTKLTAC